MNNIVLHNEKSRFVNAEKYKPGEYVITNDWEIKEGLGENIDVVLMSFSAKAIAVDYIKKEIRKTNKANDDLWKEVVSKKKYNKDWGYYWGIEIQLYLIDKKEFGTYFACTDGTRRAIKNAHLMLGRIVTFASEKISTPLFDFYVPLLLPGENGLSSELINEISNLLKG